MKHLAGNDLTTDLKRQIEGGTLKAGTKLESIRTASDRLGVSRYTVLDAYQALIGLGLVESRHGSGFYVAFLARAERPPQPRNAPSLDRLLDTALLIRGFVEQNPLIKCSGGSLPREWMSELGLHKHIRSVAAQPSANLYGYGTVLGDRGLREAIQGRMSRRNIPCTADQVLMTTGISQGLELIVRSVCHPGDLVFVESPAYYNLFGLLEVAGLRMRAVPRLPEGPDVDHLEAQLKRGEVPRVFFLQSQIHNPTGGSMSPALAHRILLLAEQYDFLVAENDVYGDLAEEQDVRLASLDGLRRVVYLSGFTKTLSANLRVGYVVAGPGAIEFLSRTKLVTCISSCEFAERVVYHALTDGSYDRFTANLRRRLKGAQESWGKELQQAGWVVFPSSRRGLFVWARHPAWEDSGALARAAAAAGFWLAPGSAFDPEHQKSAWVRFNVAYRAPALSAWLKHPV